MGEIACTHGGREGALGFPTQSEAWGVSLGRGGFHSLKKEGKGKSNDVYQEVLREKGVVQCQIKKKGLKGGGGQAERRNTAYNRKKWTGRDG